MDLDNHHKLSGNSFVTISSLCYLQILRFKDLEIFADTSKKEQFMRKNYVGHVTHFIMSLIVIIDQRGALSKIPLFTIILGF